MPTKHERKYSLSELQTKQIGLIYGNLRQLRCDGSHELRKIGGSISASKRADLKLQSIADLVNSALQLLHSILNSSQEPRVSVMFEIHPPYDPPCGHNPVPSPEPPAENEIPAPDPGHLAELDRLVNIASQCEYHWTRRHGIPLSGLKYWRNALLKELRFFRETMAAVPPLLPQFHVNECNICKLAKIPDELMKD